MTIYSSTVGQMLRMFKSKPQSSKQSSASGKQNSVFYYAFSNGDIDALLLGELNRSLQESFEYSLESPSQSGFRTLPIYKDMDKALDEARKDVSKSIEPEDHIVILKASSDNIVKALSKGKFHTLIDHAESMLDHLTSSEVYS